MERLLAPALILCFFIGSSSVARTQTRDFSPTRQDSVLLSKLCSNYQQHYQEELNQLPSENKKDFKEIYGDRWKNIKEKFDKKEVYTDAGAQAYLDALVAEIVRANPRLAATPFHCYFSRSYIPNASYIGEGIILFNMGLFDRLANESEAAFILCHEISHYILRHQENSMNKYVTTINSAEVQAKLRKIKGSEYRKSEQLESLVKGLTFDSRRHSRDHEAQADSMAVILMGPTRYDPSGALTTLALLDGVDKDSMNVENRLQEVFDSKDYPFKKKWLKHDEGLLGGHARLREEELSDSLKTHPSCPLRIKLLTPMVQAGRHVQAGAVVDAAKFAALQERFRYEVIEYAYASDDYSESLFLSLELLPARPADGYLVANIGRVMNGLYRAQKGHRLSKVADMPSPGYPSSYNALLQFIQNLYLEDIASISYNFLGPWHPQLDGVVLFRNAYEESVKNVKEQ
jgi:Zn-dependent protease with chaperone function